MPVQPLATPKLSTDEQRKINKALLTATAESYGNSFLKELLNAGAQIDAKDGARRQSLHNAALAGNIEAVELLLERGADVNAKDHAGVPPLFEAAWANNKKTTAFLLKKGADINAVDQSGDTALHHAVNSQSRDTTSLLLENGADITAKDHNGRTALDIARFKKNFKLVGLLEAADARFAPVKTTPDDTSKEVRQDGTLLYKRSSDFKKGEKGIEAVVVLNEAGLVEAGVEPEVAQRIWKNLAGDDKDQRIVVIKDAKDSAVRIFSGYYRPAGSYDRTNHDGKTIRSRDGAPEKSYYDSTLLLTQTIDLEEPSKTVEMDKYISIRGVEGDGRKLNARHINQIQEAIEGNKIGQSNEQGPSFDELLKKGTTGEVQYAERSPNTPIVNAGLGKTLGL